MLPVSYAARRECLASSFLALSAAILLAVLPVHAAPQPEVPPDDEPDSLSWEIFSQDRNLILHFLDWAATNPPPPEAAADAPAETPATFPFAWYKPAQLPFVETPGWKVGSWRGEECLYGERYRTSRTWQTIEVPEDGVYRFWIRQAHTKGTSESNFFSLSPAPDDEHPADTPPEAVFALFSQTFLRANGFRGEIGYSRPRDPAPEILVHPTPADGFLWEATHKMAFLRKGRYVVSFSAGVVTTPRNPLCITDYVLVGDPLFSPEGLSMAVTTNGHWKMPPETRSALYAVRPGAGLAEGREPPAARLAWWKAWREALYDRLVAEEHGTNYFWGGLASNVAFDEETGAVDRPSRLRALRRSLDVPGDFLTAYGDEFTHDSSWVGETGYYHRVHTARAIRSEGRRFGTASHDFEIPRAGVYHLWTLIYQSHILKDFSRGAMRIDVRAGDRAIASYIVGAGDGSVVPAEEPPETGKTDAPDDDLDAVDLFDTLTTGENATAAMADAKRPSPLRDNEGNIFRSDRWNDSGALDLPAGRVTVSVTSVIPPWQCKSEGHIWRRIFCRAILVPRGDFNPDLLHEFPDGGRVGDGEIGFWRSPDPWAGVGRFTGAATGTFARTAGENSCRIYDWTPLPDGEVNRDRHAVSAAHGEILSELLVIRNNTGRAIRIEPALSGDLPGRVRLVAWAPTPDGSHTPRFLLARRSVTLPPRQNTLLWINLDCSDVAPGRHAATLAFGGLAHTWDVDVAGSIADVPAPLAYPWSSPFARESCWRLYRDLGFNIVSGRRDRMAGLSRKTADLYGMRLFGLNAETNTIAATIADWRRRGFDYRDFCFFISDEPGLGAMTNWVATAKAMKAIDPQARLWCNTGFFPDEEHWDDCREFMSYWDVFCPFRNAFIEGYRAPVDPARLAAYRKIGDPRIGYITPSTSIYWLLDGGHEILEFAKQCREVGRDGWSSVRFQTELTWELAHPELQPIFSGAWNRTISTRYAETAREANLRWRRAVAGLPER